MQCILREKLMSQMIKLADVSNIYRTQNYRFVDAYFNWLQEAEKDLSSLRSPISILLQAEKSSLTSVLDGYLPDYIQNGKSTKKNQRAVAAQSLDKISKEIYSKIESIDRYLEQINEQLCHAIAVLANKEPDLFNGLKANQHGIDSIWDGLGRIPETRPMYNYFCNKLAQTDRNYLIIDIIQKALSNREKKRLNPGKRQRHI